MKKLFVIAAVALSIVSASADAGAANRIDNCALYQRQAQNQKLTKRQQEFYKNERGCRDGRNGQWVMQTSKCGMLQYSAFRATRDLDLTVDVMQAAGYEVFEDGSCGK